MFRLRLLVCTPTLLNIEPRTFRLYRSLKGTMMLSDLSSFTSFFWNCWIRITIYFVNLVPFFSSSCSDMRIKTLTALRPWLSPLINKSIGRNLIYNSVIINQLCIKGRKAQNWPLLKWKVYLFFFLSFTLTHSNPEIFHLIGQNKHL